MGVHVSTFQATQTAPESLMCSGNGKELDVSGVEGELCGHIRLGGGDKGDL